MGRLSTLLLIFKMVFARSALRLARPTSSLLSQRFAQGGASLAPKTAVRTLTATSSRQGKVLLCLYDGKEHAKQEPQLLGTTENELVDAEVIITTPFHPGYLTEERLRKAKNLKLAVTAGIGSDHVDLNVANEINGGITVAEVTGSNVVSVAE